MPTPEPGPKPVPEPTPEPGPEPVPEEPRPPESERPGPNGDGAAVDTGAEIEEIKEAVEELEDRWRRAMAELDNQRKRHARELGRERDAERDRVAAAWLPVLDHLDLALAHTATGAGTLGEGVQAIRDQAVQVMRGLGYPRHDETGVPFDPALHEVVTVVDEPTAAPGTVVNVLRAGYGDPERQLRPAVVTVSRKQE
jgi:molecular chaperone GrpE